MVDGVLVPSLSDLTNYFNMNMNMKPALIIVDMINDFYHPEGLLYDENSKKIWNPVISNIRTLLEVFRSKNLDIIYLATSHRKDCSDIGIGELPDSYTIPAMDFNRPYLSPCGFVGTKGAKIIDELTPLENDIIVMKRRYSGFFNTDLDMILRRKKINTLFMTGGDVDCCVKFTCADAYYRDYNVVLITDCVASDSEAEYSAAVQNIRKLLGTTRTLAQAVEWLNKTYP